MTFGVNDLSIIEAGLELHKNLGGGEMLISE
jgi:hypothetical protein